ncbi:MAG: ElyC/SanA/YdcF family protein [Methylococcaceae bacterium]
MTISGMMRFLAISSFLLLLIFALFNLGIWLSEPANKPVQADLIVALGGGSGESDQMAARLYKAGYADKILITGMGYTLKAGLNYYQYPRSLFFLIQGIPNEALMFDGQAINTHQESINLAALMTAQHWRSVLVVSDAIARHNLHNMTLLPPVSQNDFKNMLAEFDIGLFSLHHDHTTHNFPGKLLGYMVQEKPILGSVNLDNDLKDILEKAEAGLITINGDDDEGLLNNALKLLHDSALRKTLAVNAKQLLAEVFSVQAAANSILAAMKRID